METRNNVGYYYFMILVILVSSTYYGVHAQNSMYECWGGCYNNCFIRNGSSTTQADSLACDYNCLTTCIPHSAADFNYYCQIGCSLKLCIPVSYGMVQDWRAALVSALISAKESKPSISAKSFSFLELKKMDLSSSI
ncbi:hypothetical protein OROGR_027077 [Orobanche gracilis]